MPAAWSVNRDAELRRLWSSGVSARSIAEVLGCSPGAARERARRLGLPPRDPPGRPRGSHAPGVLAFASTARAIAVDLMSDAGGDGPGPSLALMAEILGVTRDKVRWARRVLGPAGWPWPPSPGGPHATPRPSRIYARAAAIRAARKSEPKHVGSRGPYRQRSSA